MPSGSGNKEVETSSWNEDDEKNLWLETETDLATIRKLLEGGTCPSCKMPFDKGKKRKLIDTCGHERCYSCMFRQEACPLCDTSVPSPTKKTVGILSPFSSGGQATRPKVKTNGHFTTYMQSRQGSTNAVSSEWPSPSRLPKTRPSPSRSTRNEIDSPMTQSCPTPPQGRRRFFLSSKTIRNPWNQKGGSKTPADPVENPCALSVSMSSSTESRYWPSYVLGKIKSLWSMSSSVIGLNQLLADDEGGNIRSAGHTKKSSQSDLYTRLGLLLGDTARRGPRVAPSPSRRLGSSAGRGFHSRDSCASVSSLASLDTHMLTSTNTSPVSTLTVGSSEPDINLHDRTLKDPSSDSITSLMSVSGQSNYSSSPISRRHSVTTSQPGQVEELSMFRNRRTSIRRSARSGSVKGPIDPKVRFAQFRTPQLTLKPLFFEVPLLEPDPLFLGRHWLIREMEDALGSNQNGVLLVGSPGTGKTALILQLVEYSCFGRRQDPHDSYLCNGKDRPTTGSQSIYCQINLVSERIRHLASHIVGYHFCQADNNSTCLVPDFIHSLAAQLCQAPQLEAYKEHLLNEPHFQGYVSLKECVAAPDIAFTRGILEPLTWLHQTGKISGEKCVILVDALCEAEYHRPDHGDTLAQFLTKHLPSFPSWLKIVTTVRTHLQSITAHMPCHKINLDNISGNENLQKDLLDYINFRLTNSPSIQTNVTSTSGKLEAGSTSQFRFTQHLLGLCRGSFLFAKLTLDLLERGHLVAKSTSYKVLPVSLGEIFLLHFNLRFPTVRSYEKVLPIISVCLAALYPLTLLEIYYSVCSLHVDQFLSWEEFLSRFKLLSGILVKRMDNTYMFFHPSFREWLIRRDEGESTKFLCEPRMGHAGIALRLTRVQVPLDPEKSLELGHHILKAHIYKNLTLLRFSSRDLQAYWVVASSEDISAALGSLRNIYAPNVKVSRLLLLAGASPNYVTECLGNAPILCMYAHEGMVDMVSLLLEFGADMTQTNSQGCTALSLAATRGHCEVVRRLVSAGASLGMADTAGQCPLVHAARNNHLSVVQYLLGCEWVIRCPQSEVGLNEAAHQALVVACTHGHIQIVEYLLSMVKLNIDEVDTLTGETALTAAACQGHLTVCSLLLHNDASPSITNRKELAPLLMAVKEGHWPIAEKLLQHHAPIEQCDISGKSALSLAAAEGHVALVELLLDRGACISKQDREGLASLSWACVRGRVQVAQCLIDRGADVNLVDKTGRSPLDLAAFQGNPSLVQLLLERGAMIEHVDINGMRPLDRAVGCRNTQVVQCFLKKGAKLGPATWAMAAGKPEIMLILLNKLLEDGNTLYRKSRLKEAAHRYHYALKKFPPENMGEHQTTFEQLRINFLLNQSRCKRKMEEYKEAVELANQVLKMKPDSFEAFYARAKAKIDIRSFEEALSDIQEAMRVAPANNREVKRVLTKVRCEIRAEMSGNRTLATSVDMLNEPDLQI